MQKGFSEFDFCLLPQFNPKCPLSEMDPNYRASSTLDDKAHILVLVIRADSVSIIDDKTVMKMKDVRAAACDKGESRCCSTCMISQFEIVEKHETINDI